MKNSLAVNGLPYKALGLLFSTVLLLSCDSLLDDDPKGAVSGTLYVSSIHYVDSDVNDPAAPFIANDSIATAQLIPNPGLVGGYVNQPGMGPNGRSRSVGDVFDVYQVDLNAGQIVTLSRANSTASLALELLLNGQSLEKSTGNGNLSVTAPSTGTYHLRVEVSLGASGYLLTVGVNLPATASSGNGFSSNDDFIPGELIVKFKPAYSGFSPAANRAAALGMTAKGGAEDRDMLLGINVGRNGGAPMAPGTFSALGIEPASNAVSAQQQLKQDTITVAAALQRRSDVESVRLNYRVYPARVPNDSRYPMQWHYPLINLPLAWDISTGSPDVIVAVLDTGILPQHPDLDYQDGQQGQFVSGYDFVSDPVSAADLDGPDSDPTDPNSSGGFHGTYVAGIVAANTNNSQGVAGVSWNSKVMPLRVLGVAGGSEFDVMQGVLYAAGLPNDTGIVPTQRADVINLSLGRLKGAVETLEPPSAYAAARNAGVILIAAAGNDGSATPFLPAAYTGVVSVSAVDISRQYAAYSNYGSTIDVAAPGGGSTWTDINGDNNPDYVLSTAGDDSTGVLRYGYSFMTGTSIATPHVSGVAALMKSVYPNLSPDEFDNLLRGGLLTQDLGITGWDERYGYGLVDAYKALTTAQALAAGNAPSQGDPLLQVAPGQLNFGLAASRLRLILSNWGGGIVTGVNISQDSGGWLQLYAVAVDGDGLGEYQVLVDRSRLAPGIYTANVRVSSDFGFADIPVSMEVAQPDNSHNAGVQHVKLLRAEDQRMVGFVTSVVSDGGVYHYRIGNVKEGRYILRSGSDLDNDGAICEIGESCGAYPVYPGAAEISVLSDVVDRWDFEVGYNLGTGMPQ
ncbi:MAG: S8 family serine peptidase [Gammaproteobacteria bacterium]|nr:S8 family serine peptidase [Gammaproteobacteria bacterium]MDH5799669.1 S8 family serine peptidase [Gammaproteobacteria bacterium]